jgi:hypothetical protein
MKGFLPRRGIGLCLLGVDNPSTYEDFCTGEVPFNLGKEGQSPLPQGKTKAKKPPFLLT